MERLWTPWRFEYVTGQVAIDGCLFCWAVEGGEECDQERLVLHRAEHNFVIINKYPYNNGHLMVAPYAHVDDLEGSTSEQLAEMILLARACSGILRGAYCPHGFNIGMNLGAVAGAGVKDHAHLHVVPRWTGDVSFLTTTSDTRVVPELPEQTYERLRPEFATLEL